MVYGDFRRLLFPSFSTIPSEIIPTHDSSRASVSGPTLAARMASRPRIVIAPLGDTGSPSAMPPFGRPQNPALEKAVQTLSVTNLPITVFLAPAIRDHAGNRIVILAYCAVTWPTRRSFQPVVLQLARAARDRASRSTDPAQGPKVIG